jgi:hypothetical protein
MASMKFMQCVQLAAKADRKRRKLRSFGLDLAGNRAKGSAGKQGRTAKWTGAR